MKYTDAGGQVAIVVEDTGSGLELGVEDSGGGISEADLPFIFDRFYRADQSRSSSGYGLGLSIARTIARAHRADIVVSSVEGRGSVFRVRFPSTAQVQEIFS